MSLLAEEALARAFATREIEEFLELFLPPAWRGVAARIVESGAQFSDDMCDWAPRWSKIPPTTRRGRTEPETALKSCLYRAHDCLHQLWGLPVPSERLDQRDAAELKRAQMCGEVAVLTLTEFDLASYWYGRRDEAPWLAEALLRRNALPLARGPLAGKSTAQIAQRLDDLLHKKSRPRWVKEMPEATAFVEDYVPMLEQDRANADHNWALMKAAGWRPAGAPNSRYASHLDGLELTQWMVADFFHLLDTDDVVDGPLRDFNRSRREGIRLPAGWNGAPRGRP